jgi:hypothetical protein
VTALAEGAPQQVTETFTATCDVPGVHTFSFTTSVALAPDAGTDPDPSNNSASVDVEIDCVIPVAVNVKGPGSNNPINLNSTVPVTVLSNEAGEFGLPVAFDATGIDAPSVRFGTSDEVVVGQGADEIHGEIHGGNGDAVMHFKAAETDLAVGDTDACVFGTVHMGGADYRFYGCDSVSVLR